MNYRTRNKAFVFSLVWLLWFCPGLSSADQSATPLSLNDGVYNKSQAKSGKKLYKKHCISCHEKGYFEPVLLTWQGQPAATLFSMMSAAMPESAPGSLAPDEYADIFAYVLKEAGYPASSEALKPTSKKFASVIIQPPE